MRLQRLHLFIIVTSIITTSGFSQTGKFSISKEPKWISKNSIDYNKTLLDKEAQDGYIDISYEMQVSLADQSRYFRISKKIISQAGVQNASEVSVSYDPSYQHLIFHSLRIIRKAETLNRLELSKFKIIHQESELVNFIYNGRLNAVLIIEDVRQGDIIEYCYTVKGFNPIFKNKYADGYSFEFYFPMYEVYYKLIVPPGRKVFIKNLNQTLQPAISDVNGEQIYEWRKSNIPSLPLQDYTPSWYDPYAQVLVTEYNNWKEVNDWAMELFPVKKELSTAVLKKVTEIKATYTQDEERAKAALNFVQDDVRYMGIEIGKNSYKPADPSKVFAQRFGDCKEKSYLLCCMLQAMNIVANPVLINTESKNSIKSWLPAPINFDHVTVRLKLDNTYYWLDPTIPYQRGSIKKLYYPDYQVGLVISDTTTYLTDISFRNISSTHIKEYFKITDMLGKGGLTVSTTFQGHDADVVRNSFNNESNTELMNSYQKYYARYYEDIKADSLTYSDNDSTGTFTTTEHYSIPNFWELDKDKVKKFYFSPFLINSILQRPKEKDRKMPFVLSYPAKYKEEIIIELPTEWNAKESKIHLKNKCYTYNCKFYSLSNKVYLETDYENYKDHATIDEAPIYFRDMSDYDDNASFEVSFDDNKISNSKINNSSQSNKNLLVTILFVGIIIVGFIWWSQRN